MKNEIILFESEDMKLEVNIKDETVWLTQKQMTELFGRSQAVISRHITNIFQEGELVKKNEINFIRQPLCGCFLLV